MRVIIAIDGSEDSLEAGKFFAQLPFDSPSEVIVVTALVESQFGIMAAETGETLREEEKNAAERNFSAAKVILEPVCASVSSVIKSVHPSRLILDVAKEHDADLIVIGARGHSAIYRILLGSTADYVANHAKCSVLVVRSSDDAQSSPAENQIQVLLAYDGSPHSKTAYRQLAGIKWSVDTTAIHIAMLLERPKLLPDDVIYDSTWIAESEQAVSELGGPANFECPVTHTVREALHLGNALQAIADDQASNLIFVGESGKTALGRFFLGSTSRYILHHVTCSVWIAREKQWS